MGTFAPWGNGTATTRSFDLNGRLTQFPLGATTGTGATPNGLSRTVNYDVASRITAHTHADTTGSTGSSTATAANQTFGYDDNDRLISYLPATSSQSYSYDANGNRVGQTVGGSSYTQSVDPASNRQTASTGPTATTNSYDAAGNQTNDGTITYNYSDRGRLASVAQGTTSTSYLYNGLGQRIIKQGANVPTGATRYVYDDAGHLIGEYDQAGNTLEETVYLGDTPIATVKNGTAYYIYADQIDTPRVITDTNNLMVWRWDQTDPFGAAQPDGNPSGQGTFTYNLRFPGQVYDAETGKHYNANRDYDPASGRYIQSDPIGLAGGQPSTYAYVNGNPLTGSDSSGLFLDEYGTYLAVPATAVAVSTAPAWAPVVAVGAAAAGAGAAVYQACHNGNDDECKKLIAEIYKTMSVVEGRLSDLYADNYDLYNLANQTPSPSLPKGTGSWAGHITQVTGWQRRLRDLIDKAIKKGCKVPKYAWDLAYAKIPSRPMGK